MKHSILTLFAGAFLTANLLTSCQGKVTTTGENSNDTDSITEININDNDSQSKVSDEEAIALIEEFYKCDNWEEEPQKYLSPDVIKKLKDDLIFDNDSSWLEEYEYAFWEVYTTDPVGDMDLLDMSKAEPTGDGRYEKRFTTAYWGDHSEKRVTSLFYTVERINGKLTITKIEDESDQQ